MITRKLRAARALSLPDWWLLFRAWRLLLVVDVGLRLLPFPRVRQFAARAQPGDARLERDEAVTSIQCLRRLVDMAGRHHLYPMGCLRRALVLQRLLDRRGILTDLRIGVSREAGVLSAHAWLDHGGQPIGGAQALSARYAPLRAERADR